MGSHRQQHCAKQEVQWPLTFIVLISFINVNIFEELNKHSTLDLLIDFCYGCGCYLSWESLEILVPSQSLAWHERNKISSRVALGLAYHYCGWFFPIVQQENTATTIFTSFEYAYFVFIF